MLDRSIRAYLLVIAGAVALLGGCGTPQRHDATAAAPATEKSRTGKLAPGKYIAADGVDVRAVLPAPSSPGSPISRGEIEVVLAAQADASPEAKARALKEDRMTVWIFADVLGPGFNGEQMPRTAALFKQVDVDARPIVDRAKNAWGRPRPPDQDPRVKTLTNKPENKSYPSGHSTYAAMWAVVLKRFAPDQAEAIAARARLVMLDRVVAGVHFPTDVAAGYALGTAIGERMLESAAFKEDFEAARAEWVK